MRHIILLSLLFALASCSSFSKKAEKETSQKDFQYTFKTPTRTLLASSSVATMKVGHSYFSASGYECKRYKQQSSQQKSACKIGKHWYNASPIILEK